MAQRVETPKTKKNKRDKLVLLVGALCVMFMGTTAYLSIGNAKKLEAQQLMVPAISTYQMVKVAVPNEPIKAGQRLGDVRFQYIQYPEANVGEGTLRSVERYLDHYATVPLPARLPVHESNLTRAGNLSNAVIERIPDGMRAITIRTDVTQAVEGWANAGSIVDVIHVNKARSSLIAERVKILSAERNTQANGVAKPDVPTTVTILVSQEQALAITTASNNGKLMLALRNAADAGNWLVQNYNADRLDGRAAQTSEKKADLNGYIKIEGEGGYALVDGKWIEADGKPDGFLVREGKKNARAKR